MSWPAEDRSPSPVAPMPDETQWLPKRVLVRASGQHAPKPAFHAPPAWNAWFRDVQQNKGIRKGGRLIQELVMNSKTVQWIVWALVMVLFTWLTLAARWTDLAVAMTIAAVLWYGIVPQPRSR